MKKTVNTKVKPDFSGLATAYETKCADGRTIATGAFKHQDGAEVPLVWRHQHDSMDNVLGHGVLAETPKGSRLTAKFNSTKNGLLAKQLVMERNLKSLSVYANQVVQDTTLRVTHGMIREVSLVLSGKNPGAVIDNVFVHSTDPFEDDTILDDEIIIHSGEDIEILVEDEVEEEEEETEEVVEHQDGKTVRDVLGTFDDKQKLLLSVMLQRAFGHNTESKLTDGDSEVSSSDLQSAYASLDEEQKTVLHAIVGEAIEDKINHGDDMKQKAKTHNVFEEGDSDDRAVVMSHDDMNVALADAIRRKASSLQDIFIEHAGTYGIDNIDLLFPDAVDVDGGAPRFYSRDLDWVEKVLARTRNTPFARIKSRYADITADEARAKGYVTGAEKFEEVFPILSRTTTPQTIYKKQKLDRDDVIDITDFDVISWMKAEMRVMLREEIARAVLVGDGRTGVDPDKIIATNVRPIWQDDVIYSHLYQFTSGDDSLDIIDGILAQRENYKGAGTPTLYCPPAILTAMLLVRDTTGRRIYETEASLAAAMRVKEIVEVPVMTGLERDAGGGVMYDLLGIVVNLSDYTIGADKGGQTSFFDDFDIDFNQLKFLLETRMSGALTAPKSALVFEQAQV